MVEESKSANAGQPQKGKPFKERTPAETADLMKQLYKMPYEFLNSEDSKTISEHNSLFKVIIIGDSGVGKSCLMHRVTNNEFINDHEVTVGVEFGSLIIKLE